MFFEISFFCFRCGSLIFDVVLKFSIKVAEDYTISRIQNSILDGQLGGLNVNTSYIIGIPPILETRVSTKSVQTITTVPTRTTPKSDGLFQFLIDGNCIEYKIIVFLWKLLKYSELERLLLCVCNGQQN